jgi:membrane protease YdiL (CAAX protease family)
VLGFCTWLASVLLLLVVPLLVCIPYVAYVAVEQHGLRPETLITDKTLILLSLIGVIPAHALTILVAWAVVTRWGQRPFWETIRWSWPENFGPWKSALLAVVLLALGTLLTWALGGGETQLDQLIKSSYAARITTAFIAAATAPFVEEVTYRGVLYPSVERAFGAIWAVLLVTALFAGVHYLQYSNNLGVIAVITMLSLSLTLVRAFTGRLLPCFMMHLVFNGIQAIYIIMAPYIEAHSSRKTAAGAIQLIELFVRRLG